MTRTINQALGALWGVVATIGISACTTDSAVLEDESYEYRDSDGPPRGGGWYLNNGVFHPTVHMFDVDESLGGGDGVDSTQIVTDNDLKATRYAIECALDGEQSITETINGTPVEFEGALGLAPQWYGSSCDTDCQQWVSACLLARTNLTGVAGADVELWIDDPTSDEDPDPDYTFEAGFFGNLFTSTGGYLCQDVGGVVGSVTAARVCSATTGCLVPLTNRYLSCNGGLLPRCDDEPGTPHHHDCQAGLVPSGTKFNTLNIYVEPNAVEVLAGALGL